MMEPGDAEWLKEQIEAYRTERPIYQKYACVLRQLLEGATARLAPEGAVQARAKSLSSFAGKAMLKKDKYACPAAQLTDLAGARVIVLTEDEVEHVCVFIRENFLVDQANSEDCTGRLKAREFGYRGIHLVVQLPFGKDSILGVDVPPEIERRKAEIQVHTQLQNAWAAIGHDRIYKSPFPLPRKLEREGAQVAALLETSDKEFGRLVEHLDAFSMNHGVAVDSEHLLRELVDLSVLRVADADLAGRAKYALRQAQLAKTLRAWELVILFLEDVRLSGIPNRLADHVRLELGQARCLSSQPATASRSMGEGLLAQVARPRDAPDFRGHVARADRELRARAAVVLARFAAGTKKGRESEGTALYRLAIQCDPTNPYHLSAFLDFETGRLAHADYAELMRPGLLAAIGTCHDQSTVRIELPQAFFVAGKFYLVLGQPQDALGEYAKGVRACLDPENCMSIRVLDEEWRRHQELMAALPPEAAWIERLLAIAHALKADPAHPCAGCVERFAAFADPAGNACTGKAKDLRKIMDNLRKNSDAPWTAWPGALHACAPCAQARPAPASEALRPLASATPPCLDRRPVLIVAGGTDASVEHRMREYRDHLLQALLAFRGTLCSGATEQGIPGLVGDVVREVRERGNRDQHLVGYLPRDPLPEDARADPRYDERIRTSGRDFTPMEPLQNWIDIIVAGIQPSDVRLLGINGGKIAAAEYRIALALGASVAVVESSGRAVAELLPDLHWWEQRNLLVLPSDRMAVRAFVMEGYMPSIPDGDALETAARKVHENFLREGRYQRGDPTVMPFEFLTDDLQQSNRQQVAYWIQMIRATGYDVRQVAGGVGKPVKFEPDEIELMAEMEHGRWIVERLRAGWRYDARRDPQKKLSPYLVPWRALTEKVKGYDRDTICALPDLLAEADWEIYRPGA